jgi:RNA polymerase sigma factor (sigma-70 family)
MKIIPDLDAATLRRAVDGDLAAMDTLLRAIEPGVYNIAVRMLGNLDDARDASQEILLKVVTHLAGFRHEAAFSTWVYRIASNHLLTAATRSRESPEVSFEAIADKLQQGLDFGGRQIPIRLDSSLLESGMLDSGMMTPEDKAAAVGVAIGCTQGMLLALDRDQRLAFLLDVVFGLGSDQAAEVIGITAAAFRKRLSRARERLAGFMQSTCGLVDPDRACRCDRQLPAVRARAASEPADERASRLQLAPGTLARAEFAEWRAFGDAAAIFRSHPDYRAPGEMTDAIRQLLIARGYLPGSTLAM